MGSLTQSGLLPQLAKYDIVEELGHGGMATVYRARDRRLDRDVAVKVIHKHLRENPEVAARFDAEARAVAKLRHPNIVEVYDVSEPEDPEKYLVVELLRGITLRHLLSDGGEMPPEVAAAIGVELGSALSHAHAAGVIHRDLKPENVLVEADDRRAPKASGPDDGRAPKASGPTMVRVKLTDFGIAKVLDAQGVTSTGQVLGSPAHMAPEQIEGGEVDGRADVFGLGVLLYECMVGHLPFEGKNPAQVLRRVLDGNFAPADRERPAVGSRWANILARALAKEAEQRYSSAEALATALREEMSRLGFADTAAELRAFFADRHGYARDHGERLVPVLIQRGEAARRAGNLRDAASDYNRALAYRPQDPTLHRLIGRLGRRRMMRRAAGAAALGLVAGCVIVAAGVALQRRGPTGEPPRPATAMVIGASKPLPPVEPLPRESSPSSLVVPVPAPVTPSSSADRRPRHLAAPAVSAPAMRDVKFEVMPKGAWVSIDGSPAEELFMKIKKLTVGMHTFEAHVPDSKCCEPVRREEEIKADDGSGVVQQISLSLRFRDAAISAPEAPPGAQLSCPILGIAGPATHKFPVHMSSFEQDISCSVDASGVPSQRSSVTLRAGELVTVVWAASRADGGS